MFKNFFSHMDSKTKSLWIQIWITLIFLNNNVLLKSDNNFASNIKPKLIVINKHLKLNHLIVK